MTVKTQYTGTFFRKITVILLPGVGLLGFTSIPVDLLGNSQRTPMTMKIQYTGPFFPENESIYPWNRRNLRNPRNPRNPKNLRNPRNPNEKLQIQDQKIIFRDQKKEQKRETKIALSFLIKLP